MHRLIQIGHEEAETSTVDRILPILVYLTLESLFQAGFPDLFLRLGGKSNRDLGYAIPKRRTIDCRDHL